MRKPPVLPLLLAAFVACAVWAADPEPDPLSAEGFIAHLELRLGLAWQTCPQPFAGFATQPRCAKVSFGDPRLASEQTLFAQAELGAPVLDVDYIDGVPRYLLVNVPGLRPPEWVNGFERLVYLIDDQQVALWIQRHAQGASDDGKESVQRWMALRVTPLDGAFPDYIPLE